VSGKEDDYDMAKTTRKTESAAGEKKPATRRTKAADQPAGAEKVVTRRRTKAAPEAANVAEAAGVREATAKLPAEKTAAPEPTHEEIALRAWSIYQRRGASHGQAMNDWLEARTQLLLERGLKP
jgi:hypothetical protein